MRDHFHLVGIYNSMNINTQMSSSEEPIRCDECGQEFDTIDSLKEHREVERQEKELRSKGIDDWSISWKNGLYLQRAHGCYNDILRKMSFSIWYLTECRIIQSLFPHGSASSLLNCNKKQCCTSVNMPNNNNNNNNTSRKEDIVAPTMNP